MEIPVSELLSRFKDRRILVIGDLMIDEYLWGQAERISPEAPVQVVEVQREEFVLGGAGNVANNLAALGAQAAIAGVIGTADDGKRLLERFDDLGVDARGVIPEPGRRTTRKTRVIASSQHVVRIDRETRRHISDSTLDKLGTFVESVVSDMEAVLISDYDKGLLTPSFLNRIINVCRSAGKPVIVDPKGLDFSRYKGATLITPNQKEASLASGVVILGDDTLARAARSLMETTGSDRILITRSQEGMVYFEKNDHSRKIDARSRQVYDVSGAGDTVLSVLGLSLAAGASWEQATVLANAAAGVVVGKVGTATLTVGELEAAIAADAGGIILKERKITDLQNLSKEVRRSGRKIVLTNGCFDLLHAGHIKLFATAKALGDFLIVAIDDDASVRKVKGSERPVIGERERVRVLSALGSVDAVVVFSTERLEDLIDRIRPDILVKGDNYPPEEIVGVDIVEKHGGKLVLIPMDEGYSSAKIIASIRGGASKP